MAKKTEADYRAEIVEALEKAGKNGLAKTRLKIKAKTEKEKALFALAKSGKVVNIGSKSRQQWILAVYDQPLEDAYEHILKTSAEHKFQLLPKSAFADGLTARIKNRIDEALRLILQEGKLLKLKAPRTYYYVCPDRLPPVLRHVEDDGKRTENEVSRNTDQESLKANVLAAYRKLVENSRFGFSDVHISDLRKESSVEMEALEAFLRDESRKGRAVLGIGDWALSSEEVRSGAIYIDGTPHLFVRFV